MSNGRKIRARKPRSKRGTVTPEQHKDLASIRGSLNQLARQRLVDKGDLTLGEHGARQRTWRISERGSKYTKAPVLVDRRQVTAAGLLRVPLPSWWRGPTWQYHERALVRITDVRTEETGLARIRRISERKRVMYLDPEWGAEPAKPRSQAEARAEARAGPEPCRSCGAETGEDCVTRGGKRAAWPHAARDPIRAEPASYPEPVGG